ncbi:hypothetical protein Tco_0205489 [Tanacetum coccineum]
MSDRSYIEIFLNQDLSIISSPKIDSLLEEFSGELAHIDLIPPRINEADFDPEEEIRLVEKLLYDNSSPRPPEEFNYDAVIESFSSSPIPVEGSDSLMEEIDIFLAPRLDTVIPGVIFDFSESPMIIYGEDIPTLDVTIFYISILIAPDYEASRARGFVFRSLELQSFAIIGNPIILNFSTNIYL